MQPQQEDFLSIINTLLREVHSDSVQDVTLDTRIVEDLAMDSVQLLELFTRLASEYQFDLDQDSVEAFLKVSSIGELVHLLQKGARQ